MPASRRNPNPGSGGGASGGGGFTPPGGDWEAWFLGLTKNTPATTEGLIGLEPLLKPAGVSIEWNARRTAADIRLPDGSIIDVIGGQEAGGGTWQWLPDGGAGSGGGSPTAGRARPPGSPSLGSAVSRDDFLKAFSGDTFAAAYDAARRQRSAAGGTGRQSTILGGFKASGRPSTRPATLLGY
jgi:hypothetical protein